MSEYNLRELAPTSLQNAEPMSPHGEQFRWLCPRGKDLGCFELFDTANSALVHSHKVHLSNQVQTEDTCFFPMRTMLVDEATVNELPVRNDSFPASVKDLWSISEQDRNVFFEDGQGLATREKLHKHLRAHRIMITDDGKDAPVPCSACGRKSVRCHLSVKRGFGSDGVCAFCDFRTQGCDVCTVISHGNMMASEESDGDGEMQIHGTGELPAFNSLPAPETPSPNMSAVIRDIFEDDMIAAATFSDLETPLFTGHMSSKTTEHDANDLVCYKTAIKTHNGLENAADPALRAPLSRGRTMTARMDENEKTGNQTREAASAIGKRAEANEMNLSEISKNYDTYFRALEEANQQLQERLEKQESAIPQNPSHRLGEQTEDIEKAIASVRAEFDSRFHALEHAHREQMDEFRTHQDDFSRESNLYFQELNQLLDKKEQTITTAHASLDNDFDLRFRNLEHICQDRMEQFEKRQDNTFAQWKQKLDTQNQLVAQSIAAIKTEYEMIFEKLAISTREMREAVVQYENDSRDTITASIPTSYSPQANIDQYSSRIKELEDDNKELRKVNRKLNKRTTRQENKFVRKKDFDRLKAEVADLQAAFSADR